MSKGGLVDFLRKQQATRVLASIVRRSGFDSIHGFVEAVGPEIVILSRVSDDGEPDGVSAIRLADIERVALNAVELATSAKHEPLSFDGAASLAIESALTILVRTYGVISIWMEDVNGFILAEAVLYVDDESAVARGVNDHGPFEVWLRLSSITRVDAASRYEIARGGKSAS
jgi:hypothetical protein